MLKRTAYIVAIIMATVFIFGSALINPAYAGNNGQQIRVVTGRGLNVEITGKNQNGQMVTWKGQAKKANAGSSITGYAETPGWWWKGNVTVTVKGTKKELDRICRVNVPEKQKNNNDWVEIKCPPKSW